MFYSKIETCLNRRCTESPFCLKKQRFEEGDMIDSDDEPLELGAQDKTDECKDKQSFKALYHISEWQQPKITNLKIFVAIKLPCGVKAEDFSVSVGEGGCRIELTILWPDAFVQMHILHRK